MAGYGATFVKLTHLAPLSSYSCFIQCGWIASKCCHYYYRVNYPSHRGEGRVDRLCCWPPAETGIVRPVDPSAGSASIVDTDTDDSSCRGSASATSLYECCDRRSTVCRVRRDVSPNYWNENKHLSINKNSFWKLFKLYSNVSNIILFKLLKILMKWLSYSNIEPWIRMGDYWKPANKCCRCRIIGI